MSEDEERAIVAALVTFKDQAVKPEDRAHWEGLELMFLLALRTAMDARDLHADA